MFTTVLSFHCAVAKVIKRPDRSKNIDLVWSPKHDFIFTTIRYADGKLETLIQSTVKAVDFKGQFNVTNRGLFKVSGVF